MGDFPFVESLARSYLTKGEESRCWSDYLKAHGLANYCVALDPTDVRHHLVYEIEESWYKGKHPLTYSQHRDLTERHKQLVQDYRDRIVKNFVNIEVVEKSLRSDDIFSESNMQRLQEFSEDVFKISKLCSDELIRVSSEIFLSCVQNLMAIGLVAPCHFTVLGLGSLAKGETTPYSGLEYAFIVESEDEYFIDLAVESYFRIGNLCESPLVTFDIAELKGGSLLLTDLPTTGFRINGIQPKAGNIPTGRVGGQKLTLTVDGFMELYKKSEEEPFCGLHKSDMLSSSVQIYSSQGCCSVLYELLHQRVAEYENTKAKCASDYKKRLHLFSVDIERFNDLLEQAMTRTAASVGIHMKVHILRYPTLLASNLHMCMSMGSCNSWHVFAKLSSIGFLSEQNKMYLLIALALSIYLRTKACITLKTQSQDVSLYKSSGHYERMYHVPQVLFVTLGCLLIPLNHSLRSKLRQCFHSIDNGADIQHIIGLLTRSIAIDETDFMLKVELFLFVEDLISAMEQLDLGCEGSIERAGVVKFLQILRHKYQTAKPGQLVFKYLQIACSILCYNKRFVAAIDFLTQLMRYMSTPVDICHCKLNIAECKKHLGNHEGAKSMCYQAISLCKQGLGLEQEQDIFLYMTSTLKTKRSTAMSNLSLQIYQPVIRAYDIVGQCSLDWRLCQFDESLQSLISAFSICKLLWCWYTMFRSQLRKLSVPDILSIDWKVPVKDVRIHSTDARLVLMRLSEINFSLGRLALNSGNFRSSLIYLTDSLDMRTELYDGNANTEQMYECLHLLGVVNGKLGRHSLSLEYHVRSVDVLNGLYGADPDHPYFSITYSHITDMYRALGDLPTALDMCTESVAMSRSLAGMAVSNSVAVDVYLDKGIHWKALHHCTIALEMLEELHGTQCKHPDVADVHHKIGRIRHAMCDYTLALMDLSTALDMRQALHADVNHPDIAEIYCSIARVHSSMEDYPLALQYQQRSLAMMKAVYGDDSTHIDIAKCYRDLGHSHKNLGNYFDSYKALLKALEVAESQPTSSSIRQVIASCYLHLGSRYNAVDSYVYAFECCTQALAISVNIGNSVLTSQTLIELYNLPPHLLSSSRKVQFFQLALKMADLDIEIRTEIFHHMGNCCMQLRRWREAWFCLYKALSNYQSVRFCKPSLLAQIHLSIGQLLLHLGYISQSLERSQLALDITSTCMRLVRCPIPLYISLNRDARLLTESLRLARICQHQFCEFRLSTDSV